MKGEREKENENKGFQKTIVHMVSRFEYYTTFPLLTPAA